ncbi:uncharacterized protein LOC117971960 isoform X3 [Acipenser ruthenus]|uniref:uncharacterized protein LOC117971960 isoform X3 n=1 Tax=Acipenser ruthenus TaxID=7906 RepID=UPI0027411717|nr:uncharacterized protein LOC117971960 isoform X3 [Acipenser ruthenus]
MLLRLILLFYTLQVADAGLFQYPPLVRAEVGSSVNLTCDIEDMGGKCFTVIWFKLQSKGIPTLETYQSVRAGGSLVGDEIEKTCSLNLNNAQVNDSGTYYCAFIRSPIMYLGNGSTLIVRSKKERSDDRAYIEILTPSESDGEVQSSGDATLVCLVFGVSEQARVYWVIEEDVEYEPDSGSRDSSESTPDFIRNQITIPGEVWSSGAVWTCVVETESGRNMSKSASKSVSKTGSGAGPLFLYGSLAAASFLLITLLITLVLCYRRQNKPGAYLANERDDVRQTPVRSKKQTTGQYENTGSGRRHGRPKIGSAEQDDVQYASLQLEARGRRK